MDPQIYRPPEDVLAELGIREPQDIDLEAICEHLGATLKARPLTGCEARILGMGNRAIITVSSAASPERQRFSAGHELGHWMHDRGTTATACDDASLYGPWTGTDRESRANRYSANLLLPVSMFKPRAKNLPMTLDTVRVLASMFRMSLTATALRLLQYGSYPAMLVANDLNRRLWFTRGAGIPEAVWPRDSPGSGTLAYDLLHGSSQAEPADVYADEWLVSTERRAYSIHEDSAAIAPGVVLSLLWWKNEHPLIEIEEEQERRSSRRSDGRDSW